MGTDQMTPAECMKFARLAGELSVSGEALESCAATIARLTAELAKHQPEERVGRCGCDEGGCVWGDMILHGEGIGPSSRAPYHQVLRCACPAG